MWKIHIAFIVSSSNQCNFAPTFKVKADKANKLEMKLVHTIQELQAALDAMRAQGKTIGLVPTMGALHAGHASLVKRCVAENDVAVVSVFVNPTQFNDQNDLLKYPRTLEADCRLLEGEGAAFVFAPSVEEMYPEADTRRFSYAPLDTVMEGIHRPGHFNGVCQIVSKLFDAVKPDRAYFGEKDFQQLAIIREMVRQMHYPLEIVGCPIVREADGLALSSRNARLSEAERATALNISRALFRSLDFVDQISPRPILMIVGENAHSKFFSENVYKAAAEPKELYVVPDAIHIDLYDRLDKIPFDKMESFFKEAFEN